jgi:hypothetical protein
MELVPLRIKIGRKQVVESGKLRMTNDFPDFDQINPSIRLGLNWSNYIDAYGTSWHYDHVAAFNQSDSYSPDPQVQFGVFAVPENFATAALALFPLQVTLLTEAEFEDFYNNRSHLEEPEEKYASGILDAIRARYGSIPIAKAKIIQFFTDVTEDEKDVKIVQIENQLDRSLTAKELAKVDLLCEMSPSDCKSIDPDHPSPGVNKNKKRFFKDFKNTRGFTIKP